METIEVRDRRLGFLWIGNDFYDYYGSRLEPTSLCVYLALARLANNELQECFPSKTKIAEMSGLSERTVHSALTRLKAENLVSWEKVPGRDAGYLHNRYTLRKPSANFAVSSNHLQITAELAANNDQTACKVLPTNKTYTQTQEQDSLSSPSAPESDFRLIPQSANGKELPDKMAVVIERAFAYFCKEAGKTDAYTLTDARRGMAERRWREVVSEAKRRVPPEQVVKVSAEIFKKAIDGLLGSEYHRREGYLDWKQIFKSQDKFQERIEAFENPPEREHRGVYA